MTTTAQIGTVIRIPIADLIVDSNIRKTVKVPSGFTSSIKQHGVLEPVDAYQDDDGWHLQDGQLRYLASLDAGHQDIPVLVQDPALAASAKVIKQLIKNEQRNELTDADRTGAYQTLFDLGVSADQIVRKTNAPKKRVALALSVASSDVASAAMAANDLTLDQAATIQEFEDDPAAVEQLLEAAKNRQLDHTASQLRIERDKTVAIAVMSAALGTAGITVVVPISYISAPAEVLTSLFSDKPYGTRLTPETHASCPGHAAFVTTDWHWGNNNERIYTAKPVYICTDWKANGHFTYSSTSQKGPLTDDEKAERKIARENGKLWLAATPVRIQFLAELLQRKTLPAGSELFAYQHIATTPHSPSSSGRRIINALLQIDAPTNSWDNPLPAYLKDSPSKGPHIALALALAAEEEGLAEGRGWSNASAKYMERLSAWEYSLSPIEKAVQAGTARKGVAAASPSKDESGEQK